MLIVSLSAGMLLTNAGQTNDRDRGRGLQARPGRGGGRLQIATQRFEIMRKTLNTVPNRCLAGTNGLTPVSPSGGVCPAVTGGADVVEDATYSYVISLPGAACRRNPAKPATAGARCITSTGTVNSVTRRVQTQLGWSGGPPFFEQAGLVGLDSLSFTNSNTINAGLGSNGQVTIGNSVTINGDVVLGPNAPGNNNTNPALGNSADHNGNTTRRLEPYALDLAEIFEEVEATNNNNLIPSGFMLSGRHFRINSGTYQMPNPGGTGPLVFHLCSVHLDNSVDFRLPPGREVRVFVDSPTRPGSVCTSGGTVTFNNSICVNVPNCNKSQPGLASNLKFYLAGTGGQDLRFINSNIISALFYAPNTTVDINNSIWLNGALAAKVVNVNNSIEFTWPADAKTNSGPNKKVAWSGWFECSTKPTVAGVPESGC